MAVKLDQNIKHAKQEAHKFQKDALHESNAIVRLLEGTNSVWVQSLA